MNEVCRLLGEYDVWRRPHGLPGDLANAIELMNDPSGTIQELKKFVNRLAHSDDFVMATVPFPDHVFEAALPPMLASYVTLARQMLTKAVEDAAATAVRHSPSVTEVYVAHFPSLVSELLGSRFPGVILIRYEADRDRAKKVSARRRGGCDVDIEALLKPLGGGGHAGAGSVSIVNGLTVDRVVAHVVRALSTTLAA